MAEPAFGLVLQSLMALNRVEPAAQQRQHHRLVAAAGADLQHLGAVRDLQRLGHARHHPGLADGLLMTDRQGQVAVGPVLKGFWHELFARYPADGFQHPFVGDAQAAQAFQQFLTLRRQGLLKRGAEPVHGKTSRRRSSSRPAVRSRLRGVTEITLRRQASRSVPSWNFSSSRCTPTQ